MRKIIPEKDKYATDSPVGLKKMESKPRYPTIRLDLQHIPEAKDWKIGETYHVELELKMVGISQSRFDNSAEFEIHEIEPESDADESKEESADEPGEEE